MLIDGVLEDLPLARVLAEFHEQGFARLGRVASPETLRALRARADDLMLGRVEIPGLFFQRDSATHNYADLSFGKGFEGPSLNYRKIEKLERDPLFSSWLQNPLFRKIARALLGEVITIYRAILMTKSAEGGSDLPWHQDGGSFWGLSKEPMLQIWTALDDAPIEAGCVEVVSGSHLSGLASPLGGVIQPELLRLNGAEAKATPVPVEAGSALLIHNHVWHRSGRNTTGLPRRAFSVCYMDDETKCLRKRREPRTFVRVFDDNEPVDQSRPQTLAD